MPHGAAIDRDAMIRQLRLHEGERLKPYRCTAGKLTIGIGRNLEDRGITAQESAYLLSNDIDHHWRQLVQALPWVTQLDPVRQRVLLDMAFNLGITGLLGFRNTLATVRAGSYEQAAAMMLQSKWAGQVGRRAERLSRMMATGKVPPELGKS
jgi:lysozyme